MGNWIGRSIGRYHILNNLGEGGMASVFLAYDTHLERNVAIKIIRTDVFAPVVLSRVMQRFERESRSLAKLVHPNIISVIDFGEFEKSPYLVMPLIPGGTLKQMMGQLVPYQQAAKLLIPIAQALSYAHTQGIIHRDVKPSNILLTQTGNPLLTDFGIAKILEDGNSHTLTGTGVGIGTPEYMAPEQGMGKEVDGRADIYSLGVVLFELITGRKPFIADTPVAVLFKHASDPLPRLQQFVPNLPQNVEHVIIKALAKRPEDRYQDMADFGKALEHLAGQDEPFPGKADLSTNKGTESDHTRDDGFTPEDLPFKNNRKISFSFQRKHWILLFGLFSVALLSGVAFKFSGIFTGRSQMTAPFITSTTSHTTTVRPEATLIPTKTATSVPASPTPKPDPTFTVTAEPILQIPTNLQEYISDPDWAMFGHDPARTGWNSAETVLSPPLYEIWNATIKDYYVDGLSIARGMIYLSGMGAGANNNTVYTLNLNGEIQWSYTLQAGGMGAMDSSPAYEQGSIYFGGQHDDKLYALNGSTGKEIWTLAGIKGMYASPALVHDGFVYAFGEQSKLMAVDTKTGLETWSVMADGWAGRTALWNNTLVVLAWNTRPTAYDAASGKVLWQRNDIGTYFSDLVAFDNKVFLGSSGKILALNIIDGETIWTTVLPNNPDLTDVDDYNLSIADGILYSAGGVRETDQSPKSQKILLAIDMKTGSILWQSDIASSWTQPVVANGIVYIARNQTRESAAEIVAFEAKTGKIVWQWQPEINSNGFISDFVIANHYLYLAYSDGNQSKIVCLGRK